MKLFLAVVFVLHLSNSVALGNCSVDQEWSLLEEIETKLWLLEQLVQKRTGSCKNKQATSGTAATPSEPTTTMTEQSATTAEKQVDQEWSLLGEIKTKLWLLEQLVQKRTESCKYEQATSGTAATPSEPTTTKTEQSATTAEKQEPLCNNDYDLDQVTKICYRIYTVNKTWTGAKDFCTKQHARLLVLDDLIKFDRFREILDSVQVTGSKALQVGFKYSEKYGMFLWLSGQKVENYTWGKKQPNNVGEMCGAIGLDWGGIPRMLHDVSCDTGRYYFICEETK